MALGHSPRSLGHALPNLGLENLSPPLQKKTKEQKSLEYIYIILIITIGIYDAIHNPTTKCLIDIKLNTLKVYKLIIFFSQITIKYLMHMSHPQ